MHIFKGGHASSSKSEQTNNQTNKHSYLVLTSALFTRLTVFHFLKHYDDITLLFTGHFIQIYLEQLYVIKQNYREIITPTIT